MKILKNETLQNIERENYFKGYGDASREVLYIFKQAKTTDELSDKIYKYLCDNFFEEDVNG